MEVQVPKTRHADIINLFNLVVVQKLTLSAGTKGNGAIYALAQEMVLGTIKIKGNCQSTVNKTAT